LTSAAPCANVALVDVADALDSVVVVFDMLDSVDVSEVALTVTLDVCVDVAVLVV